MKKKNGKREGEEREGKKKKKNVKDGEKRQRVEIDMGSTRFILC